MKRGNSASSLSCTRAARKPTPSSSRSTYGIGDLEPVHPSRAAIFGKLLGELGAHLAQVLQLEVVVLKEARIHHATRDGARSAISHLPGFEVDLGADQELERHRLRPELAVNLDADHVVMIEVAGLEQRPDSSVAGRMRGSKSRMACADRALEVGHVERRRRLARTAPAGRS